MGVSPAYNSAMMNAPVEPRPAPDRRLLLAGLIFGLIWWLLALMIAQNEALRAFGLTVWGDQQWTFLQIPHALADPYRVPGFVNPPWAAIFFLPLASLPLETATFIQTAIYFAALTLLIDRMGQGSGRWLALIAALGSPFAFDAVIELNLDWIIALGLLLPPVWSAPFLLAKPQIALGWVLGMKPPQIRRWIIVALLTLLASLLLWGDWPARLLDNGVRYPVSWLINVAPLAYLGPLSLLLALFLVWRALHRRDPVLGVLAGLCLVPYIAPYSLLIPYTLAAVRWPRALLILTAALWISVVSIGRAALMQIQ